MAQPTIVIDNATGSAIELKQLGVIVPASGSVTVSDFDSAAEVLNDIELQTELDAGNVTITFQGSSLTSEQSKALIQPITGLDIKHNLSASVSPTVSDDDVLGYSVGSVWIDTTADASFICLDSTTGAAVWGVGARSSAGALIAWGNESVGGTTASRFLDPWGAQNQIAGTDGTTNARHVAPRPGSISHMYVRHGNPDGNGNDVTYTLRVNGVASALAVTLASTDSQASETATSVAVAEGDNIDVEVTKAANIGNSPDGVTVQCTFE